MVLASADSEAFASLSRRPTARADRYRMGRQLRQQVSRQSLGDWAPPAGPARPGAADHESHEGRLDWLIPLRVGRMTASPYGFLRGTAIVMAEDVAKLPSTGITPVICGDSHLGNFGFYASPERDLVIDLNDFDEAHPGGWEWDLRRLVASIWVAGRQNGATEADCESAVTQCVAAYRTEVRELSETPLLARSYQRLDVDHLQETTSHESLRAEIQRAVARARTRTSDRALPKFTHEHEGRRRIVEDPPLITRVSDADAEMLAARAGRVPGHPGAALAAGAGRLHASSTSPTRSSGSAASGCAPTSCCWRAAAPTTWSSCSSSRPGGRCWPSTCTASRPGTPIRVSGWSSTSRRCRRSATRCWAGRPRTAGSTTSGSSGT